MIISWLFRNLVANQLKRFPDNVFICNNLTILQFKPNTNTTFCNQRYFWSFQLFFSRSLEKRENETPILKMLQKKLPNLPLLYWEKNKDTLVSEFDHCNKVPDVMDLHYNNFYWQVKETQNNKFYLYSAYFDKRQISCAWFFLSGKWNVECFNQMRWNAPDIKTYVLQYEYM